MNQTENVMKKIALSLLVLTAISTASMAAPFHYQYFGQAGFSVPGDDHQGDRGGR